MAIIELGQGGKLEPFDLQLTFAGTPPSAKPNVESNGDNIGSLRYAASQIPEAEVKGQTAIAATARGTIRGGNFVVGFKQIAFVGFHTAFYAGLKDSDGSIVETSSILNGRQYLDCSVTKDLRAPWAPFYLPRSVAPNGRPFEISMVDQPRGWVRMRQRNNKRDRLNFLISFATSCRFLTYFVVERPDGTHLPIKGFSWTYRQAVYLDWKNGVPTVNPEQSTGRVENQGFVDNLAPRDARFAMLANRNLGETDTLVAVFNDAMKAARAGGKGGLYEITEHENYTDLIAQEMNSRTMT